MVGETEATVAPSNAGATAAVLLGAEVTIAIAAMPAAAIACRTALAMAPVLWAISKGPV
ncbi:hypothetical protein MSZK_36470 [Mycobacterium sp. shizuoka-1]|nr:hypothetical protein MSZK_36470 [Mycobacterium sp. shizuoka-1]